MAFLYKTRGTCSRNIILEMDGDIIKDVEFIGGCTDICVISNALLVGAYCPEAEICVRADCCAGTTPEAHAAALCSMRSCQAEIV